MEVLRGCGIGAENCGRVLSDVLECVLGTRGKGNAISKNTIKKTDGGSGPRSTYRFLKSLRSHDVTQVQMSMDTSSGCRRQRGLKYAQCGLSAQNPHSESGRVLQVVADAAVGEGGLAKGKVPQIERVKQQAVDAGFETPSLCVVDHEPTALASCHITDLTPSGCTSHKWKHTIESVHIEKKVSDAIQTLHTACCPSSTTATTSTGIKIMSSLFSQNNGSIPRGFTLGRQVGNKYGWLARSCASVLHNRAQLTQAVESKELYIPDSNALDILLHDDTLPQLVVSSICYAWFKATLTLLKGDKEHEGELPILKARELFPVSRSWLVTLSRVKSKFPSWLADKSREPLGFEKASEYFDTSTATLLRSSADSMLSKFDDFVARDTEVTPNSGKALPHSNDFIEGAHATVSIVTDRLPNCNPERVASISQRKHNQGALRALGLPLVPSPDTYSRFKKRKVSSNEDVHRRIHETSMSQQLRTKYKNMHVPDLRTIAEEKGVQHENLTKAPLIEALIAATYVPPSPSSPVDSNVTKALSFEDCD